MKITRKIFFIITIAVIALFASSCGRQTEPGHSELSYEVTEDQAAEDQKREDQMRSGQAEERTAAGSEKITDTEDINEVIPEDNAGKDSTSEESTGKDSGPEKSTEDEASEPETLPDDVDEFPAGTILSEEDVDYYGVDNCFYVEEIPNIVFSRMEGKTFKEYSPVNRDELRYIRCLHKNAEGQIKIGELVMNAAVADEVCSIFRELYDASYPIEKMHLADDYDAVDESTMEDNNTSAFNVKYVELTDILDRHSYGMAIDINPLYNPYYISDHNLVYPAAGRPYINRKEDFQYKMVADDLCVRLFTEHGFVWGGNWGWPDYQHFEK